MASNEDLTLCIICFEEYDQEEKIPRLLSCSHTVCQICLCSLMNSSKEQTFKCPECRISHEIGENGVKEFPQNKYIISHLENIKKAKPQAGCKKHNRPVALFCTEQECRTSLCAMCYIEEHKSHSVTDFVQEAQKCKQNVISTIDARLNILDKRKELLKENKSILLETSSNSLCELNRRQKCLIDQITSEFQLMALIITSHREKELQNLKENMKKLDEKSLHLANLIQDVNASSDTDIVENFQSQIEKCKKITSEIVTEESERTEAIYRNYNSTCYEAEKSDELVSQLVGSTATTTAEVEFPGLNSVQSEKSKPFTMPKPRPSKCSPSNLEAECGSPERRPNMQPPAGIEYMKLVRKFETSYCVINAIHALNSGSLLLAGEDKDGGHWVVHVDQVGNVTWSKPVDRQLAGLTSINLASTPCMVLAYSEGCVIDFHVIKQKDTVLYSIDMKDHQPGCLATCGNILSFTDILTTPQSLKLIDCSCFPPKLLDTYGPISLPESLIVGLCLVERENTLMAIVSTDQSLNAFDTVTGNALWQISGCLGNSKVALYPWGICGDTKGHLFIADRSNDCIHLLSSDGSFMKTILDEVPYVQEISWDQSHERLIVQHEDTESGEDDLSFSQISTFQITYKSDSNIGKIFGDLFGKAVGTWVEDGIDTLKLGFSDISKV